MIKNNNQTTAKARTAATSNGSNKVVCFGEEYQQPENTSKPQTWNCSSQTDSHKCSLLAADFSYVTFLYWRVTATPNNMYVAFEVR